MQVCGFLYGRADHHFGDDRASGHRGDGGPGHSWWQGRQKGSKSSRYLADSYMAPIPGTQGLPSQFRMATAFIQHYLEADCAPGASLLFSDYGWSTIYEDRDELHLHTVQKSTRLNFFGNVTLVPSEGAIKLGTLMGAQLYIESKVPLSSPFVIPAWQVKFHKERVAPKEKPKSQPALQPAGVPPKEGGSATEGDAPAVAENIDTDAAAAPPAPPVVGAETLVPGAAERRSKKKPSKVDQGPSMIIQSRTVAVPLKSLKPTAYSPRAGLPDKFMATIYNLAPADWAVGSETVRMSRGGIPDMLSRDGAKNSNALFEKKRKAAELDAASLIDQSAATAVKPVAQSSIAKHLRL